jgi:hypothetical protein
MRIFQQQIVKHIMNVGIERHRVQGYLIFSRLEISETRCKVCNLHDAQVERVAYLSSIISISTL